MSISWEVGKEARELDKKPLKERLRIGRRSIKRVGYAVIFYLVTMFIFYLFL